MMVHYSGDGTVPRYVCAQGLRLYGSARSCQSVGGRVLDAAVVEEVFTLLEPAGVAATVAALSEAEGHHADRLRVFELAAERARFEAERSKRQFDAVEPENRLVARSLEAEWEARLGAVRQAEADLARQRSLRPVTLSSEEIAWLEAAGADLEAVFNAPTTTARERKQLLRALVTEVVVTVDRPTRRGECRIVWEGGATTDLVLTLPRRGADNARRTDTETIEVVSRLARHYDDATIARLLARQGLVSATGLSFTKERISSLRRQHSIPGAASRSSDTALDEDVEMMSVAEAEEALGASRATLYRWLATGFIAGGQETPGAPWRIRVDAALRAKITPEVPAGWVGLSEAADVLGVARQTVLDRIRRGELNAVHVNRGRRKGVAIELPQPQHDRLSSVS